MYVFLLVFLAATMIAGMFGWVADSRDSADWKPTLGGTRQPPR
jgi:hypothetical protein